MVVPDLPPEPPAVFQAARPVAAAPIALRTAPGGRVLARLGPRTRFGSPLVRSGDETRGGVGLISPALPNGRLGWARRGLRLGRPTGSRSISPDASFSQTRWRHHPPSHRRSAEAPRRRRPAATWSPTSWPETPITELILAPPPRPPPGWRGDGAAACRACRRRPPRRRRLPGSRLLARRADARRLSP